MRGQSANLNITPDVKVNPLSAHIDVPLFCIGTETPEKPRRQGVPRKGRQKAPTA